MALMRIGEPRPAPRGLLPAMAACACVLAALVLAANLWLVHTSSIANIDELRYELSGFTPADAPGGWIEAWLWHQPAPFKYRLLGKLPLWAATAAMQHLGMAPEPAFYRAFIACQFLFLLLTLLQLGALTRAVATDALGTLSGTGQMAVAGGAMLLCAASAPILFFDKYPVHGTPNDLLGYFLMAAALHLAWRLRLAAFCALAVLAVFCRETTLLIPFALLFFRHVPLPRRLAAALLPAAVFLAYRALWPGLYDAGSGAAANFIQPLETLAFGLLVFGPLWLLGLLGARDLARLEARQVPALAGLLRSFPAAVLLALALTLLAGRLREIRIAFMLCVYFVPFAAIWLYRYRRRLAALLRNRWYLLWGVASAAAVFRLRVWLLPASAADYAALASRLGLWFTGYTNTPQYNWVVVGMVYLWLLLLALPLAALPWKDGAAPPVRS